MAQQRPWARSLPSLGRGIGHDATRPVGVQRWDPAAGHGGPDGGGVRDSLRAEQQDRPPGLAQGGNHHAGDAALVKPETVGFSSERLEDLHRLIQGEIDHKQLAGAVTLLARHGKIVAWPSPRGKAVLSIEQPCAIGPR